MNYQSSVFSDIVKQLIAAATVALGITLAAFGLALIISIIVAVSRTAKWRILRILGRCYVEIIRNTPVLLQIMIIYFATPQLGVTIGAEQAGAIALGMNIGAYLSEAIRAGIASVPKGQKEVAKILHLSSWDTFRIIILPQTLEKIWPTVTNNGILCFLGTSLLSTISVPEITGTAMVLNAKTLLFFPTFGIALLIYIITSWAISFISSLIFKLFISSQTRLRFRRHSIAIKGGTTHD